MLGGFVRLRTRDGSAQGSPRGQRGAGMGDLTGRTSSLSGPSPTMSSPPGLSGLAVKLANTPSLPCPPPNTRCPPAPVPAAFVVDPVGTEADDEEEGGGAN
jgi:hypothetical protein